MAAILRFARRLSATPHTSASRLASATPAHSVLSSVRSKRSTSSIEWPTTMRSPLVVLMMMPR